MKRCLGVIDVAQQFGVSRDTVLSWIESEELEAVNAAPAGSTRRFYRISHEALAEFQRTRRTRRQAVPVRMADVHQFF